MHSSDIFHIGSHPQVTADYLSAKNRPNLSAVLEELVSQLPFRSEEALVAFYSDRGVHRSISMAELFTGVCILAGLTAQVTHLCYSHWGESATGCTGCKECLADAPSKLRSQNHLAFLEALLAARPGAWQA